jgi:hypothetical protein
VPLQQHGRPLDALEFRIVKHPAVVLRVEWRVEALGNERLPGLHALVACQVTVDAQQQNVVRAVALERVGELTTVHLT